MTVTGRTDPRRCRQGSGGQLADPGRASFGTESVISTNPTTGRSSTRTTETLVLLDQCNADAIAKAMEPFTEGDDPDVVMESHVTGRSVTWMVFPSGSTGTVRSPKPSRRTTT